MAVEIFLGLAPIIKAARYHSLIVAKEDLPDEPASYSRIG